MKNIKIFCSVAFLCAIIAVNVSLSVNNSKLPGINLNSLFSIAMADGEADGRNEVFCYSSATFNPFSEFYDCGDCCSMLGTPTGESLKCNYNSDDC